MKNIFGIDFCGLLTIVFVVLKLCKVIFWSWLWILSPLWIPLSIYLVGIIIILLFSILTK